MIQLAHTNSLGMNGVSCGTNIPAMIAGRIADGIEKNESKKEVVAAILRTQDELHAVCRRCGVQWPIRLARPISRSYARRVYNLARSLTVCELRRELEERFSGRQVQCPQCGGGGGDGHGAER